MSDIDVKYTIDKFRKIEGVRAQYDPVWQQCATFLFEGNKVFFNGAGVGEKGPSVLEAKDVFTDKPRIANQRFASILYGLLTPDNQKWHYFATDNATLNKSRNVIEYFQYINDLIFRLRYSPMGGFKRNILATYLSVGAFGNGVIYIKDNKVGCKYINISMSECYFIENEDKQIDSMFRKFKLNKRQCKSMLGYTGNMTNEDDEIQIIHYVFPNEEYNPYNPLSKKFRSVYLDLEGSKVIKEDEGYYSFPYAVFRYMPSENSPYADGPGTSCLPAIKMLNQMEKANIKQAHNITEPAVLVPSDNQFRKMAIKPNAIIRGGINREGRAVVQTFSPAGNLPIAIEYSEKIAQSIDDAFLVSLMQLLRENPQMTATEVIEKAREKSILTSPALALLQDEGFTMMIDRELDILYRQGLLPQMPEELIEARGQYRIVFDAPMTRGQDNEKLSGINLTMQQVLPYAQIDQTILDVFNFEEIAKISARVNNAPIEIINSDEHIQAMREQRAQAAQAQMQSAQVAEMASAQKDMAIAQEKGF